MDDNNEDHVLDNFNDSDIWEILDKYTYNDSNENNSITYCNACNTETMVIDQTKSVYTCTECGIESGELFDLRPEWNNYEDSNHNDTNRCGIATNPFLPNSSLGTVIGGNGYSRLRLLQSWNQMPYKERSLSEVLQSLEKNLKASKITKSVIDNAKILYKNISEIKYKEGNNTGKPIILRGLNRCGLIAACAFYGAKLQGSPRSIKEIAKIFDLKITQVTKGCRKFLELVNYQNLPFNTSSSHAHDFIERFAYRLNFEKNHIDLSNKITLNLYKLDIASDHQPTSLAAASLLLVSTIYNLNIPKKNISEIFGISEATVLKAYKKIYQYKKIIVDDKLTDAVFKKIKEKLKNINKETDSHYKPSNNFDKIFIMPDELSDNSLSNSLTNSLSNNLSNQLSLDSNTITIDMNNLKIASPKKRGRPKKNINSNINEI